MKRALALLIVALALLQPIFAFGSIALPAPQATTTMSADSDDDDDAFDVVSGGDPVVMAGAIALPLPEPRADVAEPAPQQLPPRIADPADHPPRLA